MTIISTINSTDNGAESLVKINDNYSALNSGKIETSVLDTDGTLAANSDAKIATQKAGKTYADTKATLAQVRADDQVMEYGISRQAIINGNFDIWQRGTSVALVDTATTFLADRWRDFNTKDGGTLPTLTRSRQLLTPGDIPGVYYFTRLTANGAGSSFGVNAQSRFSQKIENGTRNLCGDGKKVTLSFYAKSDIAGKLLLPHLFQIYGTGGAPSSTEIIKGEPITLTSTWTKYTVTFTTITLAGKTFGTDNNDCLEVSFSHMWGTTFGDTYLKTGIAAESFVGSGNIDIAQVQLCAGDVALPFQPKSFEEELRACMRYYQYYTLVVDINTISQSSLFAVELRINPTPTGGGAGYVWGGSNKQVFQYQTTRAAQNMVYSAEL